MGPNSALVDIHCGKASEHRGSYGGGGGRGSGTRQSDGERIDRPISDETDTRLVSVKAQSQEGSQGDLLRVARGGEVAQEHCDGAGFSGKTAKLGAGFEETVESGERGGSGGEGEGIGRRRGAGG